MPAEFPGGQVGQGARTGPRYGWHGIGPAARRIEGIGAGQARYADLVFGLFVVVLEVPVVDGPVLDVRAVQVAVEASLLEIVLVQPP